ncbi:MAG: dephospho-CoA kinase [Methylococcaceae bacterium]
MFKVGLTGGIGSGKTTVATIFTELGVPVIDADQVAHALVAKGQPALLVIQQAFGSRVMLADGSLNRRALSDIIFADAEQKKCLEAILHPLIIDHLQQQVATLAADYCILAIPLLFETHMTHFVDRVLVVDCSVACQVSRVMARDHYSREKIQTIINSQISRVERRAKADDLIDNSFVGRGAVPLLNAVHSNIPHKLLAEQVKTLHNLYRSLSRSQGR